MSDPALLSPAARAARPLGYEPDVAPVAVLAAPPLLAVLITGLDVLVLLGMQRWGMRKMEAFIVTLIAVIGACFIIEIFLSHPSWSGIVSGIVPRPLSGAGGEDSELYTAIGIL